jgi:hypothetical protein
MTLIGITIFLGFYFVILLLQNIKIELRYRNILLEKQNEILKGDNKWATINNKRQWSGFMMKW